VFAASAMLMLLLLLLLLLLVLHLLLLLLLLLIKKEKEVVAVQALYTGKCVEKDYILRRTQRQTATTATKITTMMATMMMIDSV
jgi:hypothetical protein